MSRRGGKVGRNRCPRGGRNTPEAGLRARHGRARRQAPAALAPLVAREEQAVAVAPDPALVPQRGEIEVGAHPRVALQLLPLPEVSVVRSLLDGLARRDRLELEELEDLVEHARRIADELLVLEDVHPLQMLAIGLEERVAAEPVLEQAVVGAGGPPSWGGQRGRSG